MKTIILRPIIAFFTFAATMILFASCSGGQQERDVQQEAHDHSDLTVQSEGTITFSDENLGKAFQHYIRIKDALVNSDAREARSASGELVQSLKSLEGPANLVSYAEHISNTDDLDVQREAFYPLSTGFAELIKESPPETGQVYIQNCPMAFDDEGAYWIAAETEINNPYFGDAMLRCGSVTGVIE